MANPVEVTKEVGKTTKLRYGRTTITANTATQISAQIKNLRHGVQLRCPGTSDPVANTQPVWIGDGHVTANSIGYTLLPGESLTVKVDDLSELYGTSNVAAQVVEWIGV